MSLVTGDIIAIKSNALGKYLSANSAAPVPTITAFKAKAPGSWDILESEIMQNPRAWWQVTVIGAKFALKNLATGAYLVINSTWGSFNPGYKYAFENADLLYATPTGTSTSTIALFAIDAADGKTRVVINKAVVTGNVSVATSYYLGSYEAATFSEPGATFWYMSTSSPNILQKKSTEPKIPTFPAEKSARTELTIVKLKKELCCMRDGTKVSQAVCGNWWGNKDYCDPYMITYCAANPTAAACMCLASKLTSAKTGINPKCVDSKCITSGYLTANMASTACPSIITCEMQNIIQNSGVTLGSTTVTPLQQCGTVPTSPTGTTTVPTNPTGTTTVPIGSTTNTAAQITSLFTMQNVLIFILFLFAIICGVYILLDPIYEKN